MIRVVFCRSGSVISPFGYPAGESPLQGATLAQFQIEALAACGLPAPSDDPGDGPTLFINDDLMIGRMLIGEFLKKAQAGAADRAVLELEPGVFTREHAPLQQMPTGPGGGPLLPLWWSARGGDPPEVPDDPSYEPIVLSTQERVTRIPVPRHWFGKDELEIVMTARPAMRVRHWMHLLSANRAASAERWLRIPKWQRGLRIAWAVVRAIVPTPARVLRSASTIGKGCHIHPTAVIEGATLGDGVRVGANAVIRFSRVGDGGFIMDGANVSFSTLGDHCVVGTHCVVGFCLLHAGASAAQNLMQMCVLGRKAITTGLSGILDMKLGGGSVAVLDQGKVVSSEQRFLGGAIGHDAVIGSGVWIAHGREIPNGYIVVRAPEAILHKVPTDLPAGEALAVVNGTLEKI